MDGLTQIVEREVAKYAGEMLNGHAYLTISADRRVFTVVSVGIVRGERITNLSLLARIVGDQVVIEQDDSNKPLAEALQQAGIPRRQIVLAYAGDPVPESM
jgi:hypothetical protein